MSDENTQEPQDLGTFPPGFEPPKKPQKRRAAKAKPSVTDANGVKLPAVSDDPMDKLVCITLHDSKEIPPGGQFVGCNGKQFWIKPGVKVVVPYYVCEVLNNAVHGVPDVNEKMQVVGVHNVPRLPYTLHMDWDGKAA